MARRNDFMGERMRQTWILGLSIMTMLCVAWTSPSTAASLYSTCTTVTEGEDESFVCQLRSQSGKELKNIEVEVAGASTPELQIDPYSWVSNTSAFYFVVQTSSVTGDQLWRMTEFLERGAYPVGKQAMGLATADASFEEKAAIGSSRLRIDNATRALKRIEPSKDSSTILNSLEKAIDRVADYNAERRAVVILTDPDLAATDLTENSAVDLARRKNVAVYVVSFGAKGKPPNDTLKRIGDKANGGTYDMSELSRQDMLEFASRLSSLLENGSIVKVKAAGLPQTSEVTLSANIDGEGRLEAEPVTIERTTEDGWLDSGGSIVGDNLVIILAALGLGAGALMVVRSVFGGRKARNQDFYEEADDDYGDDEDFGAETRILGPAQGGQSKPLAWLELIDGDGTRVPLYNGNIRVGRAKDSDIRLTNSSVHRQHAMIQMTNDGVFSIHDLGTKNGVFVNGTRQSQRSLADGDVIELGEVKLRFAGEKTS